MPNVQGTDDKKHAGKRLLTIREFCQLYGRSRSRTYELLRSGDLPGVKEGRSTLIPLDAAEAWARSLKPVCSFNPG